MSTHTRHADDRFRNADWKKATEALRSGHFAEIPGAVMATGAGVTADMWAGFTPYWDSLTLDRHMGDGGSYRLRRYGQFDTSPDAAMVQLPHGRYTQPRSVNSLNGGVDRLFDPLEPGFANHPVLRGLLDALRCMVDQVEGRAVPWNIRLHPYRILAQDQQPGQPTPEGLHRDGVHYIVSLFVQRRNVFGGQSQVTDSSGCPLLTVTLVEPMQTLISNDERTLHRVSAVQSRTPGLVAYRDVLVVAFTKREMS